MRVVVLASGSKGNCTYVETEQTKILIDCGISYKQLRIRLASIGVEAKDITGIFLTHEHTDHVGGLQTFCNNLKPTIFLSQGTFDGLNYTLKTNIKNKDIRIISSQEAVYLFDLEIQPVDIHHDAREPLGFIIHGEGKKVVYITDTGYIDMSLQALMQNANLFVLEANHDPEILWGSSRPFELKKRIAGDHGHMSNEDSAVFIAQTIGPETKYVLHAHMSEECNLGELVTLTYKKVLDNYGVAYQHIKFIHTLQYEPTEDITL